MSTSDQQHVISVTVRGYETDANGHVNHAVYHQYGEHGRTEALRAAGVTVPALADAGLGPVLLETTVRFLAELRVGEEVRVTTTTWFGPGRTFRMDAELVREHDGVTAASVTGVMGILDHATRRLVADPRGRLRALAADPAAYDALFAVPADASRPEGS